MAGRPKTSDGTCSKCRKNPHQPNHRYCVDCFREYRETSGEAKLNQVEGRGFSRGVEAMASTLSAEFDRFDRELGGEVTITCSRVAEIIREAPRPRFDQLPAGS